MGCAFACMAGAAAAYLFAGFMPNELIALPVAVVLMVGTLIIIGKVGRLRGQS